MRHVINMTAAGAVGLVSIFAVDILNLYYISLLGDERLTAAIGYASTIMFFTISLNIGFSIAATAIVSRAIGSGEIENSRQAAGTVMVYTAIASTITAILLYPFIGPILALLGAKGYVHEVALNFMRIVILSVPLMALGMCTSGLLRAKGDAKRSMYVTLSAGIVAAILDPLLIFYFDLGVQGAAISTALTRIAMVAIGFYGVWKIHNMIAKPKFIDLKRFSWPFIYIAIPALLTQVATPFSNAYMTATMSEFGDGAVTGWTIIGRLVPLAFVAMFTLSAAIGPILGQNLGAKLYERINSTMRDSLIFIFIYTMIVWAILALFSDQIVSAFGVSNEAGDLVRFFCFIIGGTYLFQGGLYVANAAFNNLGYPFLSTIFNWGRASVGTIPFVWYGSNWGANGALAGFVIGGIFFGITAIVTCFWVIRRLPEKHAKEIAA